jgi:hypothetical protein
MAKPAAPNGRPTKAQAVNVADRRKQLIEARIQGRRFEDIWRPLGYGSRSHATKDFQRTLEKHIAEQTASTEVYREAELMRLDDELARLTDLYAKVERLASDCDDGTKFLLFADRLLKIEDSRRRVAERRAKLQGLDAPLRAEVRTIDAIDEEIANLNKQLAALDSEDRETDEAEGVED